MDHGKGWVIYEETFGLLDSKRLVSILPARRSQRDVEAFMQQIYVDRYCSIDERLEFKKRRPSESPFPILKGQHPNPLHVGDNPYLVGIRVDKITHIGNNITLAYKILVNPDAEKPGERFGGREIVINVAI